MGNIVLSTPEWSDAGTLAVSSAATTMPGSNLQTMQPGDYWRSTTLTPYIVIDLTTARAIDTFFLGYTNATASATWRIRGASSEADLTAAPGYDSGAVAMRLADSGRGARVARSFWHAFKHLATAQTYRWWRIDIDDSTNAAGYFQSGRLYLDEAWQPATNIQLDAQYPSWVDPSLIPRSAETQTVPLSRTPYREAKFRLAFQEQAEMLGSAVPIDRMRGSRKDVLVVFDPDETTYLQDLTIYGLIRQSGGVTLPQYDRFSKTYGIEELLP